MGITARGAWEAVKRHFREMGKDIQSEPFTVVGVGDMSGDVFGNGMLLSEQIRLLAAFDHRDIFIDPNPIPRGASPSASGCSNCRARPGRTTTAARSAPAAASIPLGQDRGALGRGARGARA
jgi:glutamate dehydrogenase